MIINSENAALSTNLTDTKGASFSIEATAHAFQILSSGIYEYKIAAVIRELCTNAYDSHVAAGKEKEPFKIVLPNDIHPYFEVEDFGVGLSEEEALQITTVYFASTKRSSNEVAGGLGIGGKSPFAYTKQFNIRFRKDGIEKLAMVYIAAEGFPRMDIIHSCKTSEPNGVKVSIPVQNKDFRTFFLESQFWLSFFPTKPIVNDQTFRLMYNGVVQKLEEGNGKAFAFKETNDVPLSRGNFYAVMGPVPYAVDVIGLIEDHGIRSILQQTISGKGSMFVRFDIGEVMIAASRESLSLDEETKKLVVDKFTEHAREMMKELQTLVEDKTKHPYEIFKNFSDNYSSALWNFVPKDSTARVNKFFTKKVDIPDLYSGSYRYRSGWNAYLLKKSFTYRDLYRNSSNKITILCFDCDKKMVKTLVEDTSYHFVSYKKWSEARVKRVEKLLNVEISFVYYSELYAAYLAERRKNRVVGARNKYDKNNIPASGCIVDEVQTNFFQRERIDIDETTYQLTLNDANAKHTFYNAESISGFLNAVRGIDPEFLEEGLTIVYRNAQNSKRLDKFEVKNFDEFVDSFLEKHKETVINTMKNERFYEIFNDVRTKLLLDSDSVFLEKELKDFYKEELSGIKEISFGSKIFASGTPSVLAECGKMFSEKYGNIYNKFYMLKRNVSDFYDTHYPLLGAAFMYNSAYDFVNGDDKELVLSIMQAYNDRHIKSLKEETDGQ